MVKVIYNGTIIAQSDQVIEVEENKYFPNHDVDFDYLEESTTTTQCPLKGTANYYNLTMRGETVEDVAWSYKEPLEEAKNIKGYVAFYKDKVKIEK